MRKILLGNVIVLGAATSVATQIIGYLERNPQVQGGNGFDAATLRRRIAVIDIIEKNMAAPHVDLVEDHWNTICAAMRATTYLVADRGLAEIENRVFDAKEIGA